MVVKAYRDQPIPATVTRTSWALNMKSRTLRAEIDIHNPDAELLPGMYAYVKVMIARSNVQALPLDALTYNGDQTFCWLYEGGKAVKTELDVGISDDKWVEVTKRRPPVDPEAPSDRVPWTPILGTEQVILGDLQHLTDGAPVAVSRAMAATKPASETATPEEQPNPRSSAQIRGIRMLRARKGAYPKEGSAMRPVILSTHAESRARCAGQLAGSPWRCWPCWRRRGAIARPRSTARA